MEFISIKNCYKIYKNGVTALADANLSIEAGEFVFIIGHTLNIGINALGAYVHTNRLQFVEFFGKFYEVGGREFKPYSTNTKYYNIKEDI